MTARALTARTLLATVAHASAAAVVVGVVSALLAASAGFAAQGVAGARDATLRAAVAASPPSQRDLGDSVRGTIARGPGAEREGMDPAVTAVWGLTLDRLTASRAAMDPTVAAITGAPRAVVRLDRETTLPLEAGRSIPDAEIMLSFDPLLPSLAEVVEGELPGAIEPGEPIPVALTAPVAEAFGWQLDEVRRVRYASDGERELRLVGIIAPRDASAGEWEHASVALTPSRIDHVEAPPTFVGVGYADAASVAVAQELIGSAHLEVWYPVDPERLDARAASETAVGIRRFAATPAVLDTVSTFGMWPQQVTPTSTTPTVIDATLPQLGSLTSLLVVALAAAALAGAAVLVLAVRVLVTRRRPLLVLVAARGASDAARAGFLAVDAALPAALGGAAGLIAVGLVGALSPEAVLAGVAIVLLAAVSGAATGAVLVRTRVRPDEAARRGSRLRTAGDAGVALLAVALVAVLLTTPAPRGDALSPLAIATPLLLVALGTVLAVRLAPVALRAAESAGRARRGLVALLGPARAGRDPAAGVVPVLALLAGVALAVLGSGLLTTIGDGIRATVANQLGADIRVDARYIGPDQLAAVSAIPGVEEVAVVSSEPDGRIAFPDGDGRVIVYAVEPEAFARAATAGVPVPPDAGTAAVVSRSVHARLAGAPLELGGVRLEEAAVVPDDGPFGRSKAWIAVSASVAEQLGVSADPSALLASLAPDADPAAVREQLDGVFAGFGAARTPQDVIDERLGAPAVSALRAGLLVAVAAAGVLAGLGAVLALVLATPARSRLFALLRAVGSPRRSEYALVLWELAPVLLLAVPVGLLLGAGLVPLAVAAVDLTTFTGGADAPAASLGLGETAVVVVALVLAVGLAVLAAAAIARAAGAARAVRTIDEEG